MGKTALHIVCENENLEIYDLLISKGANVDIVDKVFSYFI